MAKVGLTSAAEIAKAIEKLLKFDQRLRWLEKGMVEQEKFLSELASGAYPILRDGKLVFTSCTDGDSECVVQPESVTKKESP